MSQLYWQIDGFRATSQRGLHSVAERKGTRTALPLPLPDLDETLGESSSSSPSWESWEEVLLFLLISARGEPFLAFPPVVLPLPPAAAAPTATAGEESVLSSVEADEGGLAAAAAEGRFFAPVSALAADEGTLDCLLLRAGWATVRVAVTSMSSASLLSLLEDFTTMFSASSVCGGGGGSSTGPLETGMAVAGRRWGNDKQQTKELSESARVRLEARGGGQQAGGGTCRCV